MSGTTRAPARGVEGRADEVTGRGSGASERDGGAGRAVTESLAPGTRAAVLPATLLARLLGRVAPAAGTVGLLVVLVVADVALQPGLLSVIQVGYFLQIALAVVLVAVAQTVVVLTGGLDLSVGGMMSVGNVLAATLLADLAGGAGHLPLLLVAGGVMGAVNGVLVAYLGYQPVVATLATWSVFNGIALLLLPTAGGSVDPGFSRLFTSTPGGVPVAFLWLGVLLAGWWGFRRTGAAIRLYAVGGDQLRAGLNGVDPRRTTLLAYVAAGAIACLAGGYIAAITYGGDPVIGAGYLLPSIAAVVVGGTSLRGGSGGLGLTVIGALVLFVLSDIITALDFSPSIAITASAVLLLAVVAVRALIERIRQ